MAFFRNYSNDTVSPSVLDDNEDPQDAPTFQSSPLHQDMDAQRGFDMNMDLQYPSEAEPGSSIRQQTDKVALPPGRRTGVSGKWGSTFWKDCQPIGSDSARQSHSGYKHSEDYLSNIENFDSENENEEDKAMNKHQSGQADVPAEEMLSDEYYEQDEDNQSDHVQFKVYGDAMNSRSLPKTGSSIHSKSRTSRAIQKNVHYGDGNDEDNDYEEEEDGKLL